MRIATRWSTLLILYGILTLSGATAVFGQSAPDDFEALADDNGDTFNTILEAQTQAHTLHSATDEDWVRFQVIRAGLPHTLRVNNAGAGVDIALEFQFADGSSLCIDEEGAGGEEVWTDLNPPTGVHLVRIRAVNGTGCLAPAPGTLTGDTSYSVQLAGDWGESVGIGSISKIKTTGSIILRAPWSPPKKDPKGAPGSRVAVSTDTCPETGLYTKRRLEGDAASLGGGTFIITMEAPWDLLNPDATGSTPGERPWSDAWTLLHPLNATVTEIVVANGDHVTAPPNSFSPPLSLTLEMMDDVTAYDGTVAIDDIPSGATCGSATVFVWDGIAWLPYDASPTCDAPGRLATTSISTPTWVDYSLDGIATKAMVFAVVPTGSGTQPTPTPCPTPTVDEGAPFTEDTANLFNYDGRAIESFYLSYVGSDDDRIAEGTNGQVLIHQASTGAVARQLAPTFAQSSAKDVSSDGKTVLLGGRANTGTFQLFDLETGALLHQYQRAGNQETRGGPNARFSPDGTEYLLTRSNVAMIRVRASDGAELNSYSGTENAGVGGGAVWYDGGTKVAHFTNDDGGFSTISNELRTFTASGTPIQTRISAGGLRNCYENLKVDASNSHILVQTTGFENDFQPSKQIDIFDLPGLSTAFTLPESTGLAVSGVNDEFACYNYTSDQVELRSISTNALLASAPAQYIQGGMRGAFSPGGDEIAFLVPFGVRSVEFYSIQRSGSVVTGMTRTHGWGAMSWSDQVFLAGTDHVGSVGLLSPVNFYSRLTGSLDSTLGTRVIAGDSSMDHSLFGMADFDAGVTIRQSSDSSILRTWTMPTLTQAEVDMLNGGALGIGNAGDRAVLVLSYQLPSSTSSSVYTYGPSGSSFIAQNDFGQGFFYPGNLDVSRDGTMFAFGGHHQNAVQIGKFDLSPWSSLSTGSDIIAVRFAPTEDMLAVSHAGGNINLYDTAPATPQLLASFPRQAGDGGPGGIAFSNDSDHLVVAGAMHPAAQLDSVVEVYDISNTSSVMKEFDLEMTSQFLTMDWESDEGIVLCGSQDGPSELIQLQIPRAVIIAGGGAYAGNGIAEQTKELGSYAFQVLKARGYTSANIQYLSAFGPQDVDGDGLSDVDAESNLGNVADTLTGSFARDAGRLLVLMIDHGYATEDFMAFRLNPSEGLQTTVLDGWLDTLQAGHPVDVSLVVDCCYSGRFVEACKKTAGNPSTRKRIVISSASSDQEAIFLPPPDLSSFAYTFLGSAYMGNSFGEAFRSAELFFQTFFDGSSAARQEPQMDDGSLSGHDIADIEFFGATWAYGVQSTTDINQYFPAFDSVSPNDNRLPASTGSPVVLWAKMLPNQTALTVVATIRPPAPAIPTGDPVASLPTVTLAYNPSAPGGARWEANVTGEPFSRDGAYNVSFVATLPNQRLSNPRFATISINSPVDSDPFPVRAVIAAGAGSDSFSSLAYRGLETLAHNVYVTRFKDDAGTQHCEWVRHFGDVAQAPAACSRELAASASILSAISSWAVTESPATQRLYVHLIGDRSAAGTLRLDTGGAETITAAQLDTALDTFQSALPNAPVVVAIDTPGAGEWLTPLTATGGQQRVLMLGSRTGESGLYLWLAPFTSFSQKYLSRCYQGHPVRSGFRAARDFFTTFLLGSSKPLLEDNGDGIADKNDGALAESLYLGRRYAFAGDDPSGLPFITDVTGTQSRPPGFNVYYAAHVLEGVTPSRVYMVRRAPNAPANDLPEVELTRTASDPRGVWGVQFPAPTELGVHTLLFYAEYPDGTTTKLSDPAYSSLTVIPPVAKIPDWELLGGTD